MAEDPVAVGVKHAEARAAWDRKPGLRTVYGHLFGKILANLVPGSVLEVGGGGGRFKEFCPHAVTTDLVRSPYADLVADAQRLPFADSSFDNIVLFDVLHHIAVPGLFLSEAGRILKPGGRVLMMEPAITTGSYLFYRFFHPEPLDLLADPLSRAPLSSDRPYDSNQAIPTLLALKHRERLITAFPMLRLDMVEWLSALAYPLSGGLRPWSLLGARAAKQVLAFEDRLAQRIVRHLAFRVMLVLSRRPTSLAGSSEGAPPLIGWFPERIERAESEVDKA